MISDLYRAAREKAIEDRHDASVMRLLRDGYAMNDDEWQDWQHFGNLNLGPERKPKTQENLRKKARAISAWREYRKIKRPGENRAQRRARLDRELPAFADRHGFTKAAFDQLMRGGDHRLTKAKIDKILSGEN